MARTTSTNRRLHVGLAGLGFATGIGLALSVGALTTGCGLPSFACASDAECSAGAASGTCESNGFCSFYDERCDSRRRYGEWSGEYAGVCVGDEPAGSEASGTPDSGIPDPDGGVPGETGAPEGDSSADVGSDDGALPPRPDDGDADGGSTSDGGVDSGPVDSGPSEDGSTTDPTDGPPGGGPSSEPDASILLVIDASDASPGDMAIEDRVLDAGYTVVTLDEGQADAAAAELHDLLILSSSVSSGNFNQEFRDLEVPIVLWEHALYADMGMNNGDAGNVSGDSVHIEAPEHPLAAGLSGTVSIFTGSSAMRWGTPAADVTVVAKSTGSPERAVYFAYERGAQMPGRKAPARRVGMMLSDDSAADLNDDGWLLFDAAVQWALED